MNRLENIANRQKLGRGRDILFACFLVIAGIVSATAVGAAAETSQVAQR